MKKRVIATLIYINCLVLVLSGCAPRLVGEAKAKEAGLALIQQAFEVDLTDAVVTVAYQEGAGVTYEDGQRIQYGTEEPIRFYNIRVNPDDENENAEYNATVNAVTGAAYRAGRGVSNTELTEEQRKKAESVKFPEPPPAYGFSDEQVESMWFSVEWLKQHFEPDMEMLCSVPGIEMTDNYTSPQQWIETYAVYRNGHIYLVELLWPTMEVTSVYLFDQES